METAGRKTALVTGASGGFGLAFAELFARDGWNVILVARSAERLDAIAADLRTRFNVEATSFGHDLAQPGAGERLFAAVTEAGLTVDALVNNAGFATSGFFSAIPLADEREEITLNVLTLTELTKLFLPQMLARRFGRIMNVASTAAFQPGPTMAVYCATKAYVLSFSEAVSNELEGSGVTMTCFCPGATVTGFAARANTADSVLFKRKLPDATSVAPAGYRAMLAGKRLEIPGVLNLVGTVFPRIIPRGLILSAGRRLLDSGTH
jgi:short-subunit dehydrogenase